MPGTAVLVREHQFLAATGNLDYTFNRVKGVSNMLLGSTGFFVDRFSASHQEGVLCLHGYGNVFQKELAQNEQIDIEPGGWVYRFGGGGTMIWNRFTGPGRVGIQSMYLHMPTSE
jgi:uncharacterized protein (AIM24 family)